MLTLNTGCYIESWLSEFKYATCFCYDATSFGMILFNSLKLQMHATVLNLVSRLLFIVVIFPCACCPKDKFYHDQLDLWLY